MKNHEADIFIFIACVIIGLLISLNISFDKTNKRVYLSAKQYLDAYYQKNKLDLEVRNLAKQLKNNEEKLNAYEYENEDKDNKIIEQIKEETKENNILLGKVDVQGPGIKIVLNDATTQFVGDESDALRIIHNDNIWGIINDLRNAGAEAISINSQRITDRTEVYCHGPFLRINGVKIAAPFYINAIGDSKVLKDYMLLDENVLKRLMARKIFVSIEESDNVKIPAFDGELKKDFMKSVVNKK